MTDKANRDFNEAIASGIQKATEALFKEPLAVPFIEAMERAGLLVSDTPPTPQERMQEAFALDRALKEAKAAQVRKRVRKYW